MNRRPKVALVGTVGLPPRYGGFETLAHFLVLHLGDSIDFTVYCSGPDYPARQATYHSAKLKYLPFRANGAQSIVFDFVSLIDSCFRAEVILVLGVSGGVFVPFVRLFGKQVVLNTDGVDWQRSKWSRSASRFLKLSEAVAVKWANVLVADNSAIASYLKAEYGRDSVLIEYGGDQISLPLITEERRRRYSFLSAPYAFSVARIQPDNNIEMILDAFSKSANHVLVLVGNWSASSFGRELKARFTDYPKLYLLEAIYDSEELNTLRGHCSIYIHGHSAGGTNPSLVEAMHLALPIAAFDVVYNRATTEGAARYFRDAAELRDLLDCVSPAEWQQQREIMKEIAVRRYCWSTIAEKYAGVLDSVLTPIS
jgi:glycosyltransferase involved in cell wall biosynthesis